MTHMVEVSDDAWMEKKMWPDGKPDAITGDQQFSDGTTWDTPNPRKHPIPTPDWEPCKECRDCWIARICDRETLAAEGLRRGEVTLS